MTDDKAQKCDLCGRPMTFVERPKFEAGSDGGRINVTLASEIWECEEHGLWRIYTSGRRERVTRTQPAEGKAKP